MARINRPGQTCETRVFRFIGLDTIEEFSSHAQGYIELLASEQLAITSQEKEAEAREKAADMAAQAAEADRLAVAIAGDAKKRKADAERARAALKAKSKRRRVDANPAI